jgi:hypothetical protein
MKFSSTTVLLSLLALSSAAPAQQKAKRALTVKSYSQFQVSDGVAGNALAEVNAQFPVCTQLMDAPITTKGKETNQKSTTNIMTNHNLRQKTDRPNRPRQCIRSRSQDHQRCARSG